MYYPLHSYSAGESLTDDHATNPMIVANLQFASVMFAEVFFAEASPLTGGWVLLRRCKI
jgi:hypothetical protein